MNRLSSIVQSKAFSFISILIFLIAATFMVVNKIGHEQIKIWDESSSAKGAVEMLINKNYFIAHNDGKPDHHDVKPPLQLWLKVISYKLFGINEFAVRFPTIISAIGIMSLLSFMFIRIGVSRAIIPLLFIIGITPGFMGYHVARHGDTDTLLMFFICGYYISFYFLLLERRHKSSMWLSLFALFIVLSTYTKSIAGLAPLIGFPVYFFLKKDNLEILKTRKLYIAVFMTLIGIGSYFIIREIIDPGFLKAVYRQHFLVIKEYPGVVKHPKFSFYFTYLKTSGFYPFFYWLPLGIIPLIWSKNTKLKKLLIFSIINATFFLLGQSALVMKNEWYIAPIYLFLWVWLALSIYETFNLLISTPALGKLKPIILSLAVIGLTYFYVNRYEKVMNRNLKFTDGYVYEPERSGHYLRDVCEKHPEIKDITIAHSYHQRQVKFYTTKYAYLNQTNFNIVSNIDSCLNNTYLITTEKNHKAFIEQNFEYEVLDSAKYGKLYFIK